MKGICGLMPIYSYKCNKCLKVYSETRGMYEESKMSDCTDCKVPVIRLYEVRGISFKGDGFYSNDKKTTIEFNG